MQETKQPSYVVTAAEILKMGITKVPMLLDNIFPKKGVAALTGSSDSGKSFLSLCLAQALCSKTSEFIGENMTRNSGSALFVCTEDSAEDICVRLNNLTKGLDFDKQQLRFIFDNHNLNERLEKELSRKPADLVILDTFGDIFSGNINDSIAIRHFIRPLRELSERHKCLFLLLHHIGKAKESSASPNKTDILGSQAIESACRTVLILKKDTDGKRIITIVKGNHIPEEIKNKGIVLSFSMEKGFELTGETVSYKENMTGNQYGRPLINEVLDLYPKLKSYKKVSEELSELGYKKVDKNKVGEIWKKFRPSDYKPKKNGGRIGNDNSTDLPENIAENASDNTNPSLSVPFDDDEQTENLKAEPTISQILIQKDSVIVHPGTSLEENDGRTQERPVTE